MHELATRKPKLRMTERGIVTTSLAVAEFFGKRHKNVLRDIEALEKGLSVEFNRLNFEPVNYSDAKGERRPMYQMTKDGFTILAMGFTGSKALAWKERYIQAFNAMHRQLVAQQQELVEQQRQLIEQHHKQMSLDIGHEILMPLFRDTQSSERTAMALDYFLRVPDDDDGWHDGWYEASFQRIGDALKLAYPRGIKYRVFHLRERGYLQVRHDPPHGVYEYRVNRARIIVDASALPRMKAGPIIAYVDPARLGSSKSSPGLLDRDSIH